MKEPAFAGYSVTKRKGWNLGLRRRVLHEAKDVAAANAIGVTGKNVVVVADFGGKRSFERQIGENPLTNGSRWLYRIGCCRAGQRQSLGIRPGR
jgi:hypothetical protein